MPGTRKVSPDQWRSYKRKGKTLLKAAEISLEFDLHDAAAVLAIHAAILMADAVLIRASGLKSASEDHRDVIDLLAAHTRNPATARRHLGTILSVKNQIEYTGEPVSPEEAKNLYRSARRLEEWAKGYLPE